MINFKNQRFGVRSLNGKRRVQMVGRNRLEGLDSTEPVFFQRGGGLTARKSFW